MSEKRKFAVNKSIRKGKKAKYCGGGGYSKLEAGMKGVLISHDRNKEKFCRLDSFRLLNHFADKYFGPEKLNKESENADDGAESKSEDEDIASILSNEVNEIKSIAKGNSSEQRRFTAVKSGCNNLIFIRFHKDISPGPFLSRVVKTIHQNDNNADNSLPAIRNVLRMHPIDFSCSAYLESMCKNIPTFLENKFKDESFQDVMKKEFTIEYKCRNNSHLSRKEVLDGLYEKMRDSECGWKYNCRSQTVSVIIDVLKTVCLVSVVKNYYFYKKYNIRELLCSNVISKIHGKEEPTTSVESSVTADDISHKANGDGNKKCMSIKNDLVELVGQNDLIVKNPSCAVHEEEKVESEIEKSNLQPSVEQVNITNENNKLPQ
ncbi:THUMP domain-containing protein 1-like isoform X1 [Styela clava]